MYIRTKHYQFRRRTWNSNLDLFCSFYWRHWVDRRQVFSTIVTMANTHQIFPRCRCVQCPNESLVSWKERRNRRYINVSLAFFHARWWHHERDQIGAFIINCCAILKQKILVEHQHHIRTTTMQEKMRFFCVLQNTPFIKENFENEQ